MIWRPIAQFPLPDAGYVIAWPTEFDIPEVWAAETYHEAKRRGPSPGWTHLWESAGRITHWAQLPPFPALPAEPASAAATKNPSKEKR